MLLLPRLPGDERSGPSRLPYLGPRPALSRHRPRLDKTATAEGGGQSPLVPAETRPRRLFCLVTPSTSGKEEAGNCLLKARVLGPSGFEAGAQVCTIHVEKLLFRYLIGPGAGEARLPRVLGLGESPGVRKFLRVFQTCWYLRAWREAPLGLTR